MDVSLRRRSCPDARIAVGGALMLACVINARCTKLLPACHQMRAAAGYSRPNAKKRENS
jgi:hypothetical protein